MTFRIISFLSSRDIPLQALIKKLVPHSVTLLKSKKVTGLVCLPIKMYFDAIFRFR